MPEQCGDQLLKNRNVQMQTWQPTFINHDEIKGDHYRTLALAVSNGAPWPNGREATKAMYAAAYQWSIRKRHHGWYKVWDAIRSQFCSHTEALLKFTIHQKRMVVDDDEYTNLLGQAVTAIQHYDPYRFEFSTYMSRVILNGYRNLCRRRTRVKTHEAKYNPHDHEPLVDAHLSSRRDVHTADTDALQAAMNLLTPRQRDVIKCKYYGGLLRNNVEVGKILGISREWVRRLEDTAIQVMRDLQDAN